jgi:Transglycosylase SLT domain
MASAINIPQTIADTATSLGIDPNVALELATVESSLNPSAVSSEGAIGLFQVMPTTAGMTAAQLMDPATNINAGLGYLAQLLAQYSGNYQEALAAYNWGPGNVNGAVAQLGENWFSGIPGSVQNYVNQIMTGAGSQYAITGITVPSISLPSATVAISQPADETTEETEEPASDDSSTLMLLAAAAVAVLIFAAVS